jgi:predicted DNA-binding transcriptional regulator YafY
VSQAPPEARAVDLKLVRQAMREQRKLLISYRDPKGAGTNRLIWPIALGFFESRRIIAGWCELRNDFRTFRADRIERVALQAGRYPGRRHDLVKQWRSQVASKKGRKPKPGE